MLLQTTVRSIADEVLIDTAKQKFEQELKTRLQLTKVNAPLFVAKNSGLNDDLNGVEKPVSFLLGGEEHQVVHSLAKWKRWYLGQLGVPAGEGLVTDMKAIRADEVLSNIHSHLVDQWDWEKVIEFEDRTIDNLVAHGTAVYQSLRETQQYIAAKTQGEVHLPEAVKVLHTEELLQLYPELTPKEREHKIAEEYGAVLLLGIGGKLSHGEAHDGRAPDYDDWSTEDEQGRPGINADLLVWDAARGKSLEISSMGVRVDERALDRQLTLLGAEARKELPFHKDLLAGKLPYTIGGGIGQSRVAMFVIGKSDIKEVQPFTS